MLFLAYLVFAGYFLTANLFFLTVGHTHEDVDQLFAIVVSLILRCRFETPAELLVFVAEELRPRFAAKHEELQAETLSAVRDFSGWLAPLNRTLWNAFANRKGMEAPHAFTFKLGRELRPSERAWFRGPGVEKFERAGPGASDSRSVYCCVKEFMHSVDLKQAPVLTIPAGRALHEMSPRNVVARRPLGEATIKNYMKLQQRCIQYGLQDAARGLDALLYDRTYSVPQLLWLTHSDVCFRWECAEVDARDHMVSNRFFPHLPNSLHLLAGDREVV